MRRRRHSTLIKRSASRGSKLQRKILQRLEDAKHSFKVESLVEVFHEYHRASVYRSIDNLVAKGLIKKEGWRGTWHNPLRISLPGK